MLSDNLRRALTSFDLVVLPAIEAGCGSRDVASARVHRANLADILDNLMAWERAAGPDAIARLTVVDELPDNVLRLAKRLDRQGVRVGVPLAARDVKPGEKWTFPEHRTMAEVIADEAKSTNFADDGDGGDAA